MASRASELPTDPVIVVTNPDEDCSPERLREFLDDLLSTEPVLETVHGAEAVRALRDDNG